MILLIKDPTLRIQKWSTEDFHISTGGILQDLLLGFKIASRMMQWGERKHHTIPHPTPSKPNSPRRWYKNGQGRIVMSILS